MTEPTEPIQRKKELDMHGLDVEIGVLYRDYLGVTALLEMHKGVPWIHYKDAKGYWRPKREASQNAIELIALRMKECPITQESKI